MLDVSGFWNSLTGDWQSFIIGVSSKLTANYITAIGGKRSDDLRRQLDNAYKNGIVCLVKTLKDDRVDLDYIKRLLNNNEVISLLLGILQDESLSKDITSIKRTFHNAGIDTETINEFSISVAVEAFIEGFMSDAELSEELIPFIQLQKLKEILVHLKGKKPDIAYLKMKYFTYLKEKYSVLSFKGLSEGKLLPFPLEKIYTRLAFGDELSPKRQEKQLREEVEDIKQYGHKETITLTDILQSEFSVITGDPGAGKSTLLKYIALAFVDGMQKERLGIEQDLIPVIFPIAAYAEACKKAESINYPLKRFIPEYFQGQGIRHDLGDLFDAAEEENNALFLFDGLDEVADETERKKMVAAIRNFIINGDNKENRYVITCRIASYTKTTRFEPVSRKEFAHFTILPFNIDQINDFLLNWYRCYEKEINKRSETCEAEAIKKRDKMDRVIKENENISDIATNPLMLTILALIDHEGGDLPKNRADLYRRCLEMLSRRWENIRSLHEREESIEFKLGKWAINEDFVIKYLGPIAYKMHDEASPDIAYRALKENLTTELNRQNKDDILSKQQADDFISIMKEQSGIIQEVKPGFYGFMHQTFKEYLAARTLSDRASDPKKKLGEKLFLPEWLEVILLAVSSMPPNLATGFLEEIFKEERKHLENLILVGNCLIDAGRDKIEDDLYDKIIDKMVEVIDRDYPIKDRVSVGETLGWLGDTRKLDLFIKIEGGKYDFEKLGKKTVETFWIGQYPVTNGWYEQFVSKGGYQKKEFWNEEGQKWLKHSNAKQPRLWDERKWRCPNSPVVGVTWYEADAFTKWLTDFRNDEFVYRLPTEEEWEATASGLDKREYPWGEDWEKDKCNTHESQIGKTSPVGIFEKGKIPATEIYDMSGNVWEWTLSNYHIMKKFNDFKFDEEIEKLREKDISKYIDKLNEKGRELPVIRGGSWNDNQGCARCADRSRGVPGSGYFGVGFRCVRTLKK